MIRRAVLLSDAQTDRVTRLWDVRVAAGRKVTGRGARARRAAEGAARARSQAAGRGDTALTYYTNDLVHTETLGTDRNTWELDAAGRLAVQNSQTQGSDGTWTTASTTTNHYDCGCDSPTWTQSGDGISRNVNDATDSLAVTTDADEDVVLQFANIHGDIAVQQPLDTAVATTVQHYDEYGNALDATASTTYGWLGYQCGDDSTRVKD